VTIVPILRRWVWPRHERQGGPALQYWVVEFAVARNLEAVIVHPEAVEAGVFRIPGDAAKRRAKPLHAARPIKLSDLQTDPHRYPLCSTLKTAMHR
jgi:hypothetical protein